MAVGCFELTRCESQLCDQVWVELVLERPHKQKKPSQYQVNLEVVLHDILTGGSHLHREHLWHLFPDMETFEQFNETLVCLSFFRFLLFIFTDLIFITIILLFVLVIFEEVFLDLRLAQTARKELHLNIIIDLSCKQHLFRDALIVSVQSPLIFKMLEHLIPSIVAVSCQLDLAQHMHLPEVLLLARWEEFFDEEIL